MSGEAQGEAIGEILTWLEQQLRTAREEQARTTALLDQVRRQVYDLSEQVATGERAVRGIDPKLAPFKGLPEKIRSIDESTEHIRQAISSNKAEIDNAVRLIRAEADYDRQERADAFRRIEQATGQLGVLTSDIAQLQAQASQVSQTSTTLIERQREVVQQVEQFGLRLDRSIEVNRDLEARIRQVLIADQEDRFEVVFERLQVVGELTKRAEDTVRAATRDETLKEDVLDQIALWRDEHARIDGRINALEEVTDRMLTSIDKLQGSMALLEGRHAGLGERVAGIRRDIAEVIDHVRDEFAKYNQLTEKQRRKQIQVLEQELREMKFHAFRPPEEP